jgi:hypothetical protein
MSEEEEQMHLHEEEDEAEIGIFVKNITTKKTVIVAMWKFSTVGELKARVEQDLQIAKEDQVMMFNTRVLQNDYTLAYYEIEPASRVLVVKNGMAPPALEETLFGSPDSEPPVGGPSSSSAGSAGAASSGEGGGAITATTEAVPVLDLHTDHEFRLGISLGNGHPDETMRFLLVVDPDDKLDHVLGQIQFKTGIPQKRMQIVGMPDTSKTLSESDITETDVLQIMWA